MSVRLTGSHGSWMLPDGETLFGRSTKCGICVLDARLSRRHAGFTVRDGMLTVSDLGSTNGVLVNGMPVGQGSLAKHGDQVVVGPCLLRVRYDAVPAPAVVTNVPPDVVSERRQSEAQTASSPNTHGTGSGSPGRIIDPSIAAAITPGGGRRKSDTDTHKPSDYHEPGTEAVTPLKPPSGQSLISPEERAAMLSVAHDVAPTIHDEPALAELGDAPTGHAPAGLRLAAGLLDAIQTSLVSLLVSAPIAVIGYGLALRQAGAGLRDGLPTLAAAGETPATLGALAGSLLHEGGLGHAGRMVGLLQGQAERGPFLTLYLAVTLALLVFLLTHLLSTVVATVLRGGPFWHRWLGLTIVQLSTGGPPSWGLALRRWCLLLVLWPLAGVGIAKGQDGLHDRWSGCAVRRPKTH